MRIVALMLCLMALVSIVTCVFTQWNDDLFLALGLALSSVGIMLDILYSRKDKVKKENAK